MKEHIGIKRLKAIQVSLTDNTYEVGTYRLVKLKKPDGTYRRIHIPQMKDKIVARAIADLYNKRLDHTLSEHSHAYRPGRSIDTALSDLKDLSFTPMVVVTMDIVGFFDQIDHQVLMPLIPFKKGSEAQTAAWKLATSTMTGEGTRNGTGIGIPQGLPLSPILSNLYLDGLDKYAASELPMVKYVRYADNIALVLPALDSIYAPIDQLADWLYTKRKLYFNPNKLGIYTGTFTWLGFDLDVNKLKEY